MPIGSRTGGPGHGCQSHQREQAVPGTDPEIRVLEPGKEPDVQENGEREHDPCSTHLGCLHRPLNAKAELVVDEDGAAQNEDDPTSAPGVEQQAEREQLGVSAWSRREVVAGENEGQEEEQKGRGGEDHAAAIVRAAIGRHAAVFRCRPYRMPHSDARPDARPWREPGTKSRPGSHCSSTLVVVAAHRAAPSSPPPALPRIHRTPSVIHDPGQQNRCPSERE